MLSDSIVLAASTGADIVLVIEAGHTQRGAAVKAKEQFIQVGRKIKGVVLNGINVRDEEYYGYGYGYGYGQYNQRPTEPVSNREMMANGKSEKK
jgi:Mrp family chromosome partitioning ATPase